MDDRDIMARSFAHTLDLVEILLSGEKFDAADAERAQEAVRRFRGLLARSNAKALETAS